MLWKSAENRKEGYQLIDNSRETVAYRLKKTVWRWFDAGQICITWGDEVVIAGPVNRVSLVEDFLTWNPAFR